MKIISMPLNHPGSGSAYRIEEDGVSCAYVTDNELDPPYKVHTTYDEWVDYLHGVDVMIHDAQYTEDDMPHKHGWGHSLISQVRQLAIDAEVKSLVMFHHDPDRSDGEIDEIQIENESHFKGKRAPAKSYCAAEGMKIKLRKLVTGGETQIEVS
jgi:ribonuclease BN (tRNA processing enzyme)